MTYHGSFLWNWPLVDEDRDSVVWHEGSLELLAAMSESASCLCGLLHFKFLKVVDKTPRRLLRSEKAPEKARG
jgi:hypothetical protein